MPRKGTSSAPPKVMTWKKALPVLIAAFISDLLRAFFNLFWFFGPALAALYCTSKVSDVIGSVGGLTTSACVAAATVGGSYFSPILASFGVIMADAAALAGFLLLTLLILKTNIRILKTVRTAMLQVGASFGVGALPIIGAIPAFTLTVYKLYRRQIKLEKAAYAKWEKENADARMKEQQQQAAQLMQYQAGQVAQAQQEASNDEAGETIEEEGGEETASNRGTVLNFPSERVRRTPAGQTNSPQEFKKAA